MWRSIPIIAFVMVLFLVLPCYGEGKEGRSLEWMEYPELRLIEYFGYLNVNFIGDVSGSRNERKIGLNEKELTDYLKLKYKNNFAGFPYKEQTKANLSNRQNKIIGSIGIFIETIDDDYPIAFHIEIWGGIFVSRNRYETSVLGYCSKQDINKAVKESISKLMEDFAIAFFKARGEM